MNGYLTLFAGKLLDFLFNNRFLCKILSQHRMNILCTPSLQLLFLYKRPVYKQLALKWQIAKQLSGFNLLSLSNNKNYRLKES